MKNILVIDDEKNIRSTLSVCLETMGHSVTAVGNRSAALAALRQERYDVAFLDLRLGSENGMDLLPEMLALCPGIAVIIITAYATFETAVEATKLGAKDYLPKPFSPAQIRHVIDKTTNARELEERVAELEMRLKETIPEISLDSAAPKMAAAVDTLARASRSDAAVLLRGESGTGKGILARMLHMKSPRAHRPFITVSCPTLSEELLSSELFGHARGAFTGAIQDKEGMVERAEGGTLFLDEISEITPAIQGKLLRFLQEKSFERVGETRTRKADVRIVAATNRDLEEAVRQGRFREDLLFRINVIEVTVPPLRERTQDIVPLAKRFLAFFARDAKRAVPELSDAARQAMLIHNWPGNVRELRNAMERAVILCPSQVIGPESLPERIRPPSIGNGVRIGGRHSLEEVEKEHILSVIASSASLDEATRILGVDASTLWRKRKRYEET
jgi:NtrC-family two-component system response regulator AlgB